MRLNRTVKLGVSLVSLSVLATLFSNPVLAAETINDAYIQEASCGPNVTGIPALDNGIGEVTISYRKGDELISEHHLIAKTELCKRVQSMISMSPDGKAPYIVAVAQDTVFGTPMIGKAVISDQGLTEFDGKANADEFQKKFMFDLKGYRDFSFEAREKLSAPHIKSAPEQTPPVTSVAGNHGKFLYTNGHVAQSPSGATAQATSAQ